MPEGLGGEPGSQVLSVCHIAIYFAFAIQSPQTLQHQGWTAPWPTAVRRSTSSLELQGSDAHWAKERAEWGQVHTG